MRFPLRFELFADALELPFHPVDLPPRAFALAGIQLRRAGHPPLGAIHDRGRHLQIAQQCGVPGSALLPLRFEEQLRLRQKALARRARALAPGGIQLAGFARLRAALSEDGGHPLAVFQTLARHRRQERHRHRRRNPPLPHLLLDRFRQNLRQRQPPRHPAHAAVEAASQLLQRIAEALL
jgi:hypothetical protein